MIYLFEFFIENCAVKRDNIVSSSVIDFVLRKCFVPDLPKRFSSLNVHYGMYILRERSGERVYVCVYVCVCIVMFKRRVLQAKLLSGGVAPGGFRSSLVSIRRKFIVAISTAHDREKGVNAIVVEAFAPKGKGRLLGMQQVREMSSSSSSFSRYPFVSLELGQ